MNKEILEFGSGSFVGQIMEDRAFFDMSVRDQARVVGWVASCPVVTELTDPANPNPGRGPEAMLNRYAQVNFWFGYIHRAAGEIRPDLEDQLMAPVLRQPGEPVGKYEPESVPPSHSELISPMGTLAGYALPRIFLEQLGTGQELDQEERKDRLVNGLGILDAAIRDAETPLELLASLAEGLTAVGQTTPEQAFKHIFTQGWLDEHNARTMLEQFKDVMAYKAPTLWARYQALTDADRVRLKLA